MKHHHGLRHRVLGLHAAGRPVAAGAFDLPQGAVPELVGVDVEWQAPLRWRLTLRALPDPMAPPNMLRHVSQPVPPPSAEQPVIRALGQRPTPPFVLGVPRWTALPAGLEMEVTLPSTAESTLETDLYQVLVPVRSGDRLRWLSGLCVLPMQPVADDAAAQPLAINYLAKDYTSIRQAMLDRIRLTLPQWQDDDSADMGVMMVEMLAYAADYLSYQQDAVATESYLPTARLRRSVQRHARLLSYRGSDGVGSRVWVNFKVNKPVTIAAHTPVVAGVSNGGKHTVIAGSAEAELALAAGTVYETMDELSAVPELNCLGLYDWGLSDYSLPAGATSCVLAVPSQSGGRSLQEGDVIIFQQNLAADGSSVGADPARRHAVRVLAIEAFGSGAAQDQSACGTVAPSMVVFWRAADALPFSLPVSSSLVPGQALTVALGNVVLADLGRTVSGEQVTLLPAVVDQLWYGPTVRLPDKLVMHCRFDPVRARESAAAHVFDYQAGNALPSVVMTEHVPLSSNPAEALAVDTTYPWQARHDLLSSGPADRGFVVEFEDAALPAIRFGNGTNGAIPSFGTRFTATARVAPQPNVNIGHDWIGLVVLPEAQSLDLVAGVGNPLAAAGGAMADGIEEIRAAAPISNRQLMSCVTELDYVHAAQAVPGVAEAAASIAWSGAWPCVTVAVRRPRGLPIDLSFRQRVAEALAPRRIAGRIIVVQGPSFVPVDGGLQCRLRAGANADAVRARLLAALGPGGLFDPDQWGFGRPLYASDLIEAAAAVKGVADLRVVHLRRADWPDGVSPPLKQSPRRAAIPVGPQEVIQTCAAFSRRESDVGGVLLLELVAANEPWPGRESER